MTTELNGQVVSTLSYYWDDQDANSKGWYVEAQNAEGEFLDDSMKVWFPVDTDDFSEDEEDELKSALAAEFPDAEIVAA